MSHSSHPVPKKKNLTSLQACPTHQISCSRRRITPSATCSPSTSRCTPTCSWPATNASLPCHSRYSLRRSLTVPPLVGHPNVPELFIRVQTDGTVTSRDVFTSVCEQLINQLEMLHQKFTREWELRRIANTGQQANMQSNGPVRKLAQWERSCTAFGVLFCFPSIYHHVG